MAYELLWVLFADPKTMTIMEDPEKSIEMQELNPKDIRNSDREESQA